MSDSEEIKNTNKKKRFQIPQLPPKKIGSIKILPNGIQAINWDNGQKIIENENFSFRKMDIVIRTQGEDVVAYTYGQFHINPGCSAEWVTYNKDVLYFVRQGDTWFMVGDDAKVIPAMYWLCVPADVRHRILNNTVNTECIVDLTFPGKIVLDE